MFTNFWGDFARRLRRNVRLMYGYPAGLRSLHFCGRRPIPRLPELASSCARPAAALRDIASVPLRIQLVPRAASLKPSESSVSWAMKARNLQLDGGGRGDIFERLRTCPFIVPSFASYLDLKFLKMSTNIYLLPAFIRNFSQLR